MINSVTNNINTQTTATKIDPLEKVKNYFGRGAGPVKVYDVTEAYATANAKAMSTDFANNNFDEVFLKLNNGKVILITADKLASEYKKSVGEKLELTLENGQTISGEVVAKAIENPLMTGGFGVAEALGGLYLSINGYGLYTAAVAAAPMTGGSSLSAFIPAGALAGSGGFLINDAIPKLTKAFTDMTTDRDTNPSLGRARGARKIGVSLRGN